MANGYFNWWAGGFGKNFPVILPETHPALSIYTTIPLNLDDVHKCEHPNTHNDNHNEHPNERSMSLWPFVNDLRGSWGTAHKVRHLVTFDHV